MNGYTEKKANSRQQANNHTEFFNLGGALKMLPLVRHIVNDVMQRNREMARIQPEQEKLDRQRHTLQWPERARRYRLREEIAGHAQHLHNALTELSELGVILLDPQVGRVGFLTAVNGHRAYFSWQHSEPDLQFWHFEGESVRRPIPLAWQQTLDGRLVEKKG